MTTRAAETDGLVVSCPQLAVFGDFRWTKQTAAHLRPVVLLRGMRGWMPPWLTPDAGYGCIPCTHRCLVAAVRAAAPDAVRPESILASRAGRQGPPRTKPRSEIGGRPGPMRTSGSCRVTPCASSMSTNATAARPRGNSSRISMERSRRRPPCELAVDGTTTSPALGCRMASLTSWPQGWRFVPGSAASLHRRVSTPAATPTAGRMASRSTTSHSPHFPGRRSCGRLLQLRCSRVHSLRRSRLW